ncbi:ATP-dependent DNA helicase UvrD2 [Ornithinimicrobium humiphilum]|uniref:DNA 3'-5' helicase n=1 Tax=Ornithinimicrobium humiphilum TaxID=125288 RepID=A0A543KQY9_9MICO|nr:ATP-dependent DNA helicase UvrD2 [Ornithinimicrobium humiphilum]TQM97495.1 Rep family ATP-dependent DNA helicase [Ornithinimicrobium humiphilum]
MSAVPGPADPDAVLEGLDPEQREVAAHPSGPMVVLAGAGTGKTRAITHRIAYGVASGAYHPSRVLAVTFTARAAGEMRTRLRGLGVPMVQARTFHAAALRQLQFFWPQAVGGPPPEVLSQKIPAVVEAAGRLRLRLDRAGLRDVAAEIEWSKVSLLTAETYPAAARRQGRQVAGLDATAMARLLEVYGEVCSERHVIDFEDVLLLTVGLLDEHPRIAAQIHEQYRHFVVDEYQDVNPLQQHLLDLWVGERSDVCVVGDPAQSIYSFTGASADHLLSFSARHPAARTVRLVRNYRSTPQVIHLANLVLAGGRRPDGPTARAMAPTVQLVAQREDGPAPTLTSYPDDEAEAQGVAATVRRLLDTGVPASEIAVLFRTNGQSEAVETALARADVPYLVRGGERFFSRAEVRAGVLLLRGAVRSDDGSSPLGEVVRAVLTGAGWSPTPPEGAGATRERWESLQALVRLADDLAGTAPGARVGDLVAELDRRAAEQHAPTVEGITLASLHAAKGLEWDVVLLVGCSEGLLPITLADTPERVEEERRLLYVGITRARKELHLSWAAARAPGGRSSRSVSRFLAPAATVLGEAAAAPGRPRRSRSGRRGTPAPRTCRSCGTLLDTAAERKVGRCSACPPTYDEAVFEALRAWRKQVAAEAGVPAFVVFTDATLTAIAESVPADRSALQQISGVGARKLELYGDGVLEVLRRESAQGS